MPRACSREKVLANTSAVKLLFTTTACACRGGNAQARRVSETQ
jgi:hypothetical protein